MFDDLRLKGEANCSSSSPSQVKQLLHLIGEQTNEWKRHLVVRKVQLAVESTFDQQLKQQQQPAAAATKNDFQESQTSKLAKQMRKICCAKTKIGNTFVLTCLACFFSISKLSYLLALGFKQKFKDIILYWVARQAFCSIM